ncbi:MAG TPA: riboflavin synthase [bacterium]|nr:riboflavin synthase [bacterium]
MFTGIIEDVGHVKSFEKNGTAARMSVITKLARASGIGLGDSVAVNGCCLTAIRVDENGFDADLSAETLSRTTLGLLASGSRVNLERSLPAGGRMGGHVVQGHVDGVGEVASVRADGETRVVTFRAPKETLPFFAEKGSVAVDGVSLTVNGVNADGFHVTLVPFTLEHTTFSALKEGTRVNLETDVMAKYVVQAMKFWKELPHG